MADSAVRVEAAMTARRFVEACVTASRTKKAAALANAIADEAVRRVASEAAGTAQQELDEARAEMVRHGLLLKYRV